MKFLIIQESGQHPANANYREALSMQRAINAIAGHSAEVWGKGYNTPLQQFGEVLDGVDVVFILENYDTGWLPDISDVKALKIFWSIDGHCALDAHIEHCRRAKYDIILNSCLPTVDQMSAYCGRSLWFPNCYDSSLIRPLGITKTHDVGFVGSRGNTDRQRWVRYLEATCAMVYSEMLLGDEMVRSINESRIHWNRNLSFDINYRTFEVCGCGTMLLTNETPGLCDLFEIGKEVVTYDWHEECRSKIEHYIVAARLRESIAEAGLVRARKDHTYDVRARQLISICEGGDYVFA